MKSSATGLSARFFSVMIPFGTRRVGNSTGRTFNSGRGMGNLNEDAGLADRKIKARPAEFGGTVLAGSPADFGKLIAEEIEKWGKVVKFADAKVD